MCCKCFGSFGGNCIPSADCNQWRSVGCTRCCRSASHPVLLPRRCTCRHFHVCLREYIHQLARDVKQQLDKEVVVFIDTNPALSITTQIALVAMTDLIIPVNADSFSMQVGCLRVTVGAA